MPSMNLSWVVVEDLNAAVEYYTRVLGLNLLEKVPEFGWAEVQGDEGMILGLAQAQEGMKAGSNAVVCLNVEDLEKTKSELVNKGVKLVGETMEVPGHVKLQTMEDPSGNVLQLAQPL